MFYVFINFLFPRCECSFQRDFNPRKKKDTIENRKQAFPPFLAHLAKGNVSFCHQLTSVVHSPSSVNFSHFNLLL